MGEARRGHLGVVRRVWCEPPEARFFFFFSFLATHVMIPSLAEEMVDMPYLESLTLNVACVRRYLDLG